MSTLPLSARLFLPVRDFGCTVVCVDAPVRLVTGLYLSGLPVMGTLGVFSSSVAVSQEQQSGCHSCGCPSPLPRAITYLAHQRLWISTKPLENAR